MHAGTSDLSDIDAADEAGGRPRRGRAALAVAGSAAVMVGGGAFSVSPAEAQQADSDCLFWLTGDGPIDLGDIPEEGTPEADDFWTGFFGECNPDFGGVKVVVDVVTDDGSPLPDDLDLDGIARSMGFSYGSAALDEASTLIRDWDYEDIGFYGDICVVEAPMCDQLGGAHFGVLASVAESYGGLDVEDNEFVVFMVGTQPPASVGTGGIVDVGSGWELGAATFSPGFVGAWAPSAPSAFGVEPFSVTLELTQAPDPTTTTEAPPTTEAPTTTAADVGAEEEAPSPTLPATGASDATGPLAWMGAALVGLGLGAVATVRRATRRV